MNTFILVVYLMSLLVNSFLHVSCLLTILMISSVFSVFDVVFNPFLSFTEVPLLLIVTIVCFTDHDDSSDIHTTCLACCVCRMFPVIGSASLFVGTRCTCKAVLESISCLWKSFYKSGQNLSVDWWSDHVNGDGSILLSTAQTELIVNQLIM